MFEDFGQPLAAEQRVSRAAQSITIDALVAVAARALATQQVTLIFTPTFANPHPPLTPAPFKLGAALQAAAYAQPLLIIERTQDHAVSRALSLDGFGFFCSARIDVAGTPIGLLCLAERDPRVLSGAQEYVLLTLAAEIASCLLDEPAADVLPAEFDRQKLRLRLLESVVVNANDAVLITEAEPTDLPGPRILYANAAFTRTTGYELADIVGKTPRILQGPDTDPVSRARLREALRRWEPIEVELLNYHRDGTPFWVELSIVPVADEGGYFTHWVSVQRDITERKQAEAVAVRALVAEAAQVALEHRAYHDELTGLRNRAYFLERVRGEVLRAKTEPGYRAAVLFFDLDRFKLVNDSLGHRIGDLMLVEVARRVAQCVPEADMLARLGGDEFTCLLSGVTHDEDAAALADSILHALRPPIRLAGHEVFASASIGIGFVEGAHDSPEDVLRDADTAMYRAKHDGGTRYALFDESMHAKAVVALRAQMDLRGALERDELCLYYQPIVDMRRSRVVGFEALVRWRHPARGLVPPADFIPLAEETGLIVPMGLWILRQACLQARIWNDGRTGSKCLSMSVNVSRRQLLSVDFFAEVCEAVRISGCDPHLLQLEITESAFIERPEYVGELLERIRGLGVRIALDDFGTGYSSLSYLERYRIDTLKIDQSFVARLQTSPTTVEIVRLILGLARALDISVTAEGIEYDEQRAILVAAGCTFAQGYLFSRPVPVHDVPPMLAATQESVALACAS